MGKGNPMLARLEAQLEAKYRMKFNTRMDLLLQMGQEAAQFAAHDELGMGPGRAVPFTVAYREALNWLANLVVEDAKSDKELWYAKAKIDERLLPIVGEENFAPWDERYDTRLLEEVASSLWLRGVIEAALDGRVVILPTKEAADKLTKELLERKVV